MIEFFLITAGLPLLAVVGNAMLRVTLRLPQSVPADLILVLIVFDFVILIDPADLGKAIPNVRMVYGFIAFISVILWMMVLGRLEKDLQAWVAARPRRGYPYRLMFLSLGISGVALIVNLAPIALRSVS